MKNLEKVLRFLHRVEKLKTVRRKVSVSDNSRKESPAEHSWRVALMAMVLHRELHLKIDLLKTLEIILVHDIVETVAGDVWILDNHDVAAHKEQRRKELRAAKEIYATLPLTIGENLESLWLEYEHQNTKEALFARALDKMEVILQRIDMGAENWEKKDIYPILFHWADDAVSRFSELDAVWKMIQNELEGKKNIDL